MTSTIIEPSYDNSIKPSTDTTYPWNASTGLIDVNFADTIGTTNAIQFIKDGYQFAWKPDTVEVLDDQGSLTAVSTVNPNATAQVWQNRLTYVGTTPLTSDEFEVQGNQLKHTVRMVAPPSLPSGYTGNPQFLAIGGDIGTTTQDWSDIDLYADGVSHRSDFTTPDDLRFVRISDGTELYRIPRITVIDANGNEALGEYKLVFQPNNVVTLYMLVPWNWMQNAVYPVAIDPTVITSASNTIPQGGRKIVKLSNGWLVTAWITSNNSCVLYVSKDNGSTWSQLDYTAYNAAGGVTLEVSGTTIYLLAYDTAAYAYQFYAFDATKATNSGQTYISTVDSGFMNGVGCSNYTLGLILGSDSTIHVTYSGGKSNAYNGNSAVYYAKSTDGGKTWTITPIQTTTASGAKYDQPIIVIRSNKYPTIICHYADNSVQSAVAIHWNGTSWVVAAQAVYASANNAQPVQMFTACVDGNDVVHFSFSTETNSNSHDNIYYTSSTDGGATWSAVTTITNEQQPQQWPNITCSEANDVYLFWHGFDTAITTSYNQIRRITKAASTGSWGSIVDVTNSATSGATFPQTLWTKFNMPTDAVRYFYEGSSSYLYDSIVTNQPPNAPTNLSPTGGVTLSSQMPVLSGTFSDPDPGNTMSALQVKVYRNSDNTLMWDSTKTAMTTTTSNQDWSIQVPSSANLAYNTQYYWTATTWDNSGAQGAWSGNQVFNLSQAPTVTVTSPTANQTVTTSSITVELSYSQANNVAESSYQFQLLDAMGNNVVQDSGTVNVKNNMYTFSGLSNNTTYQVVGYATATDGTKGTSNKVSFNTSFTVPYTPTATETVNKDAASVTVNWSNPAYKTDATATVFTGAGNGTMSQPTTTDGTTGSHSWKVVCTNATAPATFSVSVDGTNIGNATVGTAFTYNGTSFTITAGATAFAVNDEFDFSTNAYTVQYNRLYKQANGSWQLYQDQLSGTSYQDYLVGNGTAITYGVSAMGTNGVESSITSVTATPSFSGDWLYDPTTGKQFQFLYNRAPYDMATMEERQEFQTFGNKPMIRRGPLNARTGTLDALMVQIGSSQSPIQQLQAFEANMANHPAYYLKTAAGEVLKVDVHTPKRKMPQEYLNNQAIGITVNWTEVS